MFFFHFSGIGNCQQQQGSVRENCERYQGETHGSYTGNDENRDEILVAVIQYSCNRKRNPLKRTKFFHPAKQIGLLCFSCPFETLHKKLIKEDLFEKSGYFPASVKAKLKDIAYSGYRSYSRPDFLFSKEDIKLLDNLKNDNNIVIVKPDKGNGVVILDRNDYNKKMNDILQDNTKFQRLNDDPVKLTLQRENQLKKLAFLTPCDQAFYPPFLGGKIIELLAKFCFKNKRFEPSLSFFSKQVIVSHCV